ncbi:MAG: DNA methyltransferase [Candidatus Caldarchaeum sp.]
MLESLNITWVDGEDWDFAGEDTQYLTHGLHPYPARMVPQIAARLMKRYAKRNDVVLDPFCGSGGVLVEARLAGLNSVGIDINPLACLIARVKSNPVSPELLLPAWRRLKEEVIRQIAGLRRGSVDVKVPNFRNTNMEYWFKPSTMKELAVIRRVIESIHDEEVRRFFEVPFSLTVRDVSGVRKKEYKLYRIPEDEWRGYSPDTLAAFIKNAEKAVERAVEFYSKACRDVFSKVFIADARHMLRENFPEEARGLLEQYPPSLIITSPPYGDSRTTVAYGQFSRLSSLWLDFEPEFRRELVMSVDKLSLGGSSHSGGLYVDSPTLERTIATIERRSRERASETQAYFADLCKCIERMHACLLPGGHCCIVVANRTVSRVLVPTHLIIAELAVKLGFQNNITIIPRRIPTKRLPWENAPENIPGLRGRTMSRENIVILRK